MNGLGFGTVVGLDEKTCKVRVQFQDLDGVVSDWLPVIQQKTLKDQCYWMPDLDEFVVVLMDANLEAGVVLGSIYSAKVSPPLADKDIKIVRFSDGTSFKYNRKSHQLDVQIEGTLNMTVSEAWNITVGKGISASAESYRWA